MEGGRHCGRGLGVQGIDDPEYTPVLGMSVGGSTDHREISNVINLEVLSALGQCTAAALTMYATCTQFYS